MLSYATQWTAVMRVDGGVITMRPKIELTYEIKKTHNASESNFLAAGHEDL